MKAKSNTIFWGKANFKIRRNGKIIDEWDENNIVVDQGVNYLLGAGVANRTQVTAWYIGLLDNYTPVAGSVMTNFGGNEITAYDEATRQQWVLPAADPSGKSVTNSASTATFTISTNSTVVYGIFIAENSTKGGTTGKALSGILFSASKSLDDNDELIITYTFGGDDDGV